MPQNSLLHLTLFYLFETSNVVLGAERCGYGGVEPLETRENVERYGNIFPFDTSSFSQGIPCDETYTENVTNVFISFRRGDGDYNKYLSLFEGTQVVFPLLKENCRNLAQKVLCNYYLPSCGNSTTFVPPMSACQDVCEYFQSQCAGEYEQLQLFLETDQFLAVSIATINCSDTGDFITPLQHCCTDLDINIPCKEVNESTGQLVSIPGCKISTSLPTLPEPSINATPIPSSVSTTRKENGGDIVIGLSVGISALVLVFISLIGAFVSISAILRVRKKHYLERQIERNLYLNSHGSSQEKGSQRYQGKDVVHLTPLTVETGQRVARVSSTYIRQMAEEKLLIPGRSLTLMDTIGQGEFGVVYRGNLTGWRAKSGDSLVAIKTLKGVFSVRDLNNMMGESVTMAKFNHPNVMKLIGVCIDKGASPYIVMPYMAYGSLLSYLKKQRAELTLANIDNQELVTAIQCKLLSICLQVAKGMSYLAAQQFVHRDLAARNCMIDENFVLKVADFGLSEDIYARNYFRQAGVQGGEREALIKLPVRWMAIESLHDGIFTEKTDMWSYGVTMWEIFSCGRNPYPGVDPFTLMKYLDNGGRLKKPANAACSQDIYTIMSECWSEAPDNRPHFSSLVTTITGTLESMAGYMDFSHTGWSSTTTGPSDMDYDHLSPPTEQQETNDETNMNLYTNPTIIVSCEDSQRQH